MSYDRFFEIRKQESPANAREITTGATSLTCTLLGRERGGLCDRAEAVIPAIFPQDFGIRIGDLFICGQDSSTTKQWWHGVVANVDKGRVGGDTIRVEAVGIEHYLKSIKPRINFGKDPGNPLSTNYDNPDPLPLQKKQVSGGSDSVVKILWNTYINSSVVDIPIPFVRIGFSIDVSDPSTDLTYLEYDGSTSLYEIFNSLAERTGMSWGFDPTSTGLDAHTFFFKKWDGTFNANATRFTYGVNLISLSVRSALDRVTNGINLVGTQVPKIGVKFSRRLTNNSSISALGQRDKTRKIPGIRTTADAQVHAAAILARKADPLDSFETVCLVHQANDDGTPIYPGRTKITLESVSNSLYNPEAEIQFTDEIECFFGESSIEIKFRLGEDSGTTSQAITGGITASAGNTPKAAFDFDVTNDIWSEVIGFRAGVDRAQVVVVPAIIEQIHGDGTAQVRLVPDPLVDNESDPAAERFDNIEVPAGLGVDSLLVAKFHFEDDELKRVTMGLEATTGASASLGLTAQQIRYHLATGSIPIYNTTVIRDIANDTINGGESQATPDTNLQVSGGDRNARLGDLVRVPVADLLAINTAVYTVVSASYNTVHPLNFPENGAGDEYANAQLFGQVLGITSDGYVALGDGTGGTIIVNVKTAAGVRRNFRLLPATLPDATIVAAPLGAVLQGN